MSRRGCHVWIQQWFDKCTDSVTPYAGGTEGLVGVGVALLPRCRSRSTIRQWPDNTGRSDKPHGEPIHIVDAVVVIGKVCKV